MMSFNLSQLKAFPDGTFWSWPIYVQTKVDDPLVFDKYKMGCSKTINTPTYNENNEIVSYEKDAGYYLKKEKLKDTPFYTYLANQEIPTCAFSTEEEPYSYYILENGKVICSCQECQ